MNCPRCHAETYVSRGSPSGSTRTRHCPACGYEFETMEILAHSRDYPDTVQAEARQHTARIWAVVNGGVR